MTQNTAPIAPVRQANFPQLADPHQQISGPNFAMACLGSAAELTRYGVRHPATGSTIRAKVFLHELLNLTAMEISFGLLPPWASMPFFHKHQQNEEVYLFLNGQGEFRVDEQIMPITAGTAIRVDPAGVRSFRSMSDVAMHYIVIQAKAGSLEQWTGIDGVGVPGEVTWPEA